MAEQRDIKYVNREFSDLKTNLIEYAKNYFPDTYNDFSEASPGQLFIEMAAYVGDVLSYYPCQPILPSIHDGIQT